MAVRRSSKSMLERKHFCRSASTELPLGPLPFSRTKADWHSSQSPSLLRLALSRVARAFVLCANSIQMCKCSNK